MSKTRERLSKLAQRLQAAEGVNIRVTYCQDGRHYYRLPACPENEIPPAEYAAQLRQSERLIVVTPTTAANEQA